MLITQDEIPQSLKIKKFTSIILDEVNITTNWAGPAWVELLLVGLYSIAYVRTRKKHTTWTWSKLNLIRLPEQWVKAAKQDISGRDPLQL